MEVKFPVRTLPRFFVYLARLSLNWKFKNMMFQLSLKISGKYKVTTVFFS